MCKLQHENFSMPSFSAYRPYYTRHNNRVFNRLRP